MRLIFGMFLGVLLTVGAAFIHDSTVGTTSPSVPGAIDQQNYVNWAVVRESWNGISGRVSEQFARLSGNEPSTPAAPSAPASPSAPAAPGAPSR